MFAILRSRVSVARFVLGAVLGMFPTSGDISAQENVRARGKITDGETAAATSLLQMSQLSKEDAPQDKEVIAFIKSNKHVDFEKLFPSNWEAICFSGEYQHTVSDIKYELGKEFPACSGSHGKFGIMGSRLSV